MMDCRALRESAGQRDHQCDVDVSTDIYHIPVVIPSLLLSILNNSQPLEALSSTLWNLERRSRPFYSSHTSSHGANINWQNINHSLLSRPSFSISVRFFHLSLSSHQPFTSLQAMVFNFCFSLSLSFFSPHYYSHHTIRPIVSISPFNFSLLPTIATVGF